MVSAEATRGDAPIPVDRDKIVGCSKLLAAMRDRLRRKHFTISAEHARLDWDDGYILIPVHLVFCVFPLADTAKNEPDFFLLYGTISPNLDPNCAGYAYLGTSI